MSESWSVTCSDCETSLDDDPAGSIEARRSCPNCGSLARTFYVSAGDGATLSGRASLEVVATMTASADVAHASVEAHNATVRTTDPDVTSMGLEATHSAQVRLVPMNDGLWLAEVTATNGYVKTGMGDSPSDALLDLVAYMLPPDDPEFPTD